MISGIIKSDGSTFCKWDTILASRSLWFDYNFLRRHSLTYIKLPVGEILFIVLSGVMNSFIYIGIPSCCSSYLGLHCTCTYRSTHLRLSNLTRASFLRLKAYLLSCHSCISSLYNVWRFSMRLAQPKYSWLLCLKRIHSLQIEVVVEAKFKDWTIMMLHKEILPHLQDLCDKLFALMCPSNSPCLSLQFRQYDRSKNGCIATAEKLSKLERHDKVISLHNISLQNNNTYWNLQIMLTSELTCNCLEGHVANVLLRRRNLL